jgi:SOS response regulatory protein OraA/RecX
MTKTEKISREIIYNKGLRLLGHREYSVWGLRKKLREKFPDNFAEISKIVTEFVDKDWLSDERFCEYIVREKTQHSGWGERKIILKLQEHKISEDMIHEKLVKYFPENMQIKKPKNLL